MRKGFNGLHGLVRDRLQLAPRNSPSSIFEQELLKRNQQLEEKVARLEKACGTFAGWI
jgi:hypothetical protein